MLLKRYYSKRIGLVGTKSVPTYLFDCSQRVKNSCQVRQLQTVQVKKVRTVRTIIKWQRPNFVPKKLLGSEKSVPV
jgi:hypothetical protein